MTGAGILIGFAFLAGAATQRLTGLGFAIISAPFAVIAVGAWDAIGVINLVGVVVGSVLLYRMRDDIDWARVASIGIAASIAAVPGTALVSAGAGMPALDIGTGSMMLVSVLLVRRSVALRRDGIGSRVGAGLISGGMNAVAGLAGPALVVYGRLSDWETRSFVASVQPILIPMALTTLLARAWIGDRPALPSISAIDWALIAGGSVAGFVLGEWLSSHVKLAHVEKSIIIIAGLAAIVAIVRGATG